MNWSDKMDAVIKDVLGIEFTCVVNSDKSFSIFENNTKVATRQSIFYLESHWRHEVGETLKVMFDEKVRDSLLKY
jgi:hypothetical protein